MQSLKELYRIGPGPSSSHTIGVKNACEYYLSKYPNQDYYVISLTGSLALTGKGHKSDQIIYDVFNEVNKKVEVKFNYAFVGKHPNTLLISSFKDGIEDKSIIYSIGGGAIEVEGVNDLVDEFVYPEKSFKEILQFCQINNFDLAQYVYYYEPEIKDYLKLVANSMIESIDLGLQSEGVLPGSLKLKKIAKEIYQKSKNVSEKSISEKLLLTAYAYSAMEQNNSGKNSVTAPTLGSCGIVSAIVHYYLDLGRDIDELADGLAVAGVIGNIVKTNATISGAEGGCQAEIGTACAMGAGLACYMEGLTSTQIETASEIAMEHNLGLTCDPVGGYVQVPCIERNGVGVLRSIDSMLYAKYLSPLKESKVSFDMIVSTMKYTGSKIAVELRETSLGGLAEVIQCE